MLVLALMLVLLLVLMMVVVLVVMMVVVNILDSSRKNAFPLLLLLLLSFLPPILFVCLASLIAICRVARYKALPPSSPSSLHADFQNATAPTREKKKAFQEPRQSLRRNRVYIYVYT